MAHKSKLKAALEAYQGKDQRVESQKRLQKKAAKAKKRNRGGDVVLDGVDDDEEGEDVTGEKRDGGLVEEDAAGVKVGEEEKMNGVGGEGEGSGDVDESGAEDEESGFENGGIDISRIDDSESESELEDLHDGKEEDHNDDEFEGLESEHDEKNMENNGQDEGEDEDDVEVEEEDIPLSDLSSLSSTAKEDIIPHQRLQINNTTALLSSLKSISLPIHKLAFSEHQSITSTSPTNIPDINDDLNRELAFYKQSLEAVQMARKLLQSEGIPFTRPTDYFAEMVKSDEHMGRIKEKMMDEASRKKAAAEARKLRDLKKFGKQVQVAKLQERDKAKRETLNRIQGLKRKRQQGDQPNTTNEDDENDPFSNITIEEDPSSSSSRRSKRARTTDPKQKSKMTTSSRQKRDAKFGFGGKKRHGKSGDAISSGDIGGGGAGGAFSKNKGRMKGPGRSGGGGKSFAKEKGKRLGKSRRQARQ